MVLSSSCNNECISRVASTSEATNSSSSMPINEVSTIISDSSKCIENGAKSKKEKNRNSRWEPALKSGEHINNLNNTNSSIDLINFQRNILTSNVISQNNNNNINSSNFNSIPNNYTNKIEMIMPQQPSSPSSITATTTTNFVSIPSPFNALSNFATGCLFFC